MGEKQVRLLLHKAIEFLQNAGMKLRLPQLTIATAVVLFQRFYVVHSLKRYDLFKLAAAALFLAGKVEETPKKLRDVVMTAWEMDPRRKPEERDKPLTEESPEFWQLKEKILDNERELLRVVAFNLQVDHPYKFLLTAVKSVGGSKGKSSCCSFCFLSNCLSKELAHFAWNFVNDSLKTTLCLQYPPQVIGVAVLDLASKAMQVKLPGPPDRPRWWYEEEGYGVTPEQVEDVCDQLLALYEGFTQLKQSKSLHDRLRDPLVNSKLISAGEKGERAMGEIDDGGGGATAGRKRERDNSRPPPPPPPPPAARAEPPRPPPPPQSGAPRPV